MTFIRRSTETFAKVYFVEEVAFGFTGILCHKQCEVVLNPFSSRGSFRLLFHHEFLSWTGLLTIDRKARITNVLRLADSACEYLYKPARNNVM